MQVSKDKFLAPDHNKVVVSKIFYFHPYLGKIPILTNFSRGLKPPTRQAAPGWRREELERRKEGD